jgi:protein-disulfide isomerase
MRNALVRVTRVVLCSALAAAIIAPAAASALDDAAKKKVIEYYRRKSNLPPEVGAELTKVEASSLPGIQQGTITLSSGGRTQDVSVLMSADGQYVIFSGVDRQGTSVGTLEDVNSDPFAAVMKKITIEGNPTKGPKDAKVTIVEYSDFQCPYCARAHATLKDQVLKEYGDKVRVVYKNFPLSFHKWAELAAIGGECAFDQDEAAFWMLYDYYFENQQQLTPENVKEKSLEALKPTSVKIDVWTDCFDNTKTADRVRGDMAEGQSVGVTGTPAFMINGRFLSGAQPFPKFKAIIDDELQRNAG